MKSDETKTKAPTSPTRSRTTPVASASTADGGLVELVYDPSNHDTSFVVWDGDGHETRREILLKDGRRLGPYAPTNNLIQHQVVLLPSHPEEYGSEEALVAQIEAYIHRYVDLSDRFERLAAHYVLLSWIYDGFNELPYLRIRGDYGTGKTRFLLVLGSICNKPIFASGASTVAPLFHTLNAFRGTLVIDEADFRMSDEKADVIKILNNGNVKGLPVLRVEATPQKEFNPKAYHVFGPKLVATRGFYHDRALESRFITEEAGGRPLRTDVPINLPSSYRDEALDLRNKLLLYRFRTLGKRPILEELEDPAVEPRLNQIFVPLLSTVGDKRMRKEISELRRRFQDELVSERGMDAEAQVLEAIRYVLQKADKRRLSVSTIAKEFMTRFGEAYERPVTAKWIGFLIRRKLRLKTHKSHGVFVISPEELPKLPTLYTRYGLASDDDTPHDQPVTFHPVDMGDDGDVPDRSIAF